MSPSPRRRFPRHQRGRPPRAKYIFKHALVQDAAYQSLLKRTRQYYHRQVAELLAARFPEIAEAHPELVAHHYTEAGDSEPAVSNWLKAGQRSIARSANVEAVDHLKRGLELIKKLPESPERAQRELMIELALGPALVTTFGYTDPQVGLTYDHAWRLCQQIGDSPHAFIVLRGRQLHEMLAGEAGRTFLGPSFTRPPSQLPCASASRRLARKEARPRRSWRFACAWEIFLRVPSAIGSRGYPAPFFKSFSY